MDHSIITYLMDPKGDFVVFFGKNSTAEQMAEKVLELVPPKPKQAAAPTGGKAAAAVTGNAGAAKAAAPAGQPAAAVRAGA